MSVLGLEQLGRLCYTVLIIPIMYVEPIILCGSLRTGVKSLQYSFYLVGNTGGCIDTSDVAILELDGEIRVDLLLMS